MAGILKRQHQLVALKVSLTRRQRETGVQIELETNEGGTPKVRLERIVSARELGLPRVLEARTFPRFQVPPSITDELASQIQGLGLNPSDPLWLHLVKPYGYLGVVPWEQLLAPVLGRPILRLPDFLEPPRERKSVLEVALLCSLPISEPSFQPPAVLAAMTRGILSASPRQNTRVHVFADKEYFAQIADALAGDLRVLVHDPDQAAQFENQSSSDSVAEDGQRVTCPWLRWVQASMRGASLDTVHFVCHGYLGDERPAFSVAESPLRNQDAWTPHLLRVAEVVSFLNQTGAWSVAFSAPPANYSEAGLRLFADTIAQTRPGPVLYHDAAADWSLDGLRSAYAFLFAPEPREAPAPGPIFVYCQPAIVERQSSLVEAPMAGLESVVAQNASIFDESSIVAPSSSTGQEPAGPGEAPSGNVPNWVAAAQRYVEEAALASQRRERAANPNLSRNVRSSAVAEQVLRDAQEIIGRYARASQEQTRRDDLPA